MRVVHLITLAMLAVAGGCSRQEAANGTSGAAPNSTGNAAGSAAPATPADPAAELRQLAECSAKIEAVSRLYGAIADQSSGSQAAEMQQKASQRSVASLDLRMKAEGIESRMPPQAGAKAGQYGAQVAAIVKETEATLEAERKRQPFEDFAVWLGSQADRCAPLVPAADL